MFEPVDTERMFGQDGGMVRTGVRRRLLRRRFCGFLVAVSLAGAITGPVAHAAASKSPRAPVPAAGRTYVVAAGDTLWAIASDASPGNDPRPLVAAIERVNHLHAGDLVPGQALVIPTSA
jgi:hypothetical protein